MSDKDEHQALTGEVQNVDPLEKALVKINVTRVVLDTLRKEAEAFPTPKAGDKAGYGALRRHRLDIVPLRTTMVKAMKAMREEAVAFQKKVIGKEKEITEELAEIEAIDQAKEDAYLAELKAIEDEKIRLEEARIDSLIAQLTAFECAGNRFEVAQDSPGEFATRLDKAREDFRLIEIGRKAEVERLEREEHARIAREQAIKDEEDRQAKVRQEQEAVSAKLKADQDAFAKQQQEAREASDRAERERLAKIAEDERQALQSAEAEILRLKTEADAKVKAENDAKIAQLKAEEDAKAAEAERARLAALAPDKEKILDWIDRVKLSTALPKIEDAVLSTAVRFAQGEVITAMQRLETLLQK